MREEKGNNHDDEGNERLLTPALIMMVMKFRAKRGKMEVAGGGNEATPTSDEKDRLLTGGLRRKENREPVLAGWSFTMAVTTRTGNNLFLVGFLCVFFPFFIWCTFSS
ncbi:unnamed protein product [Linum trigynum]|uniref:Transmembrane protein n=1 Tax=Linum trigynum TaxID=586398 RepID=A0AAV2D8S7_9ROSI